MHCEYACLCWHHSTPRSEPFAKLCRLHRLVDVERRAGLWRRLSGWGGLCSSAALRD